MNTQIPVLIACAATLAACSHGQVAPPAIAYDAEAFKPAQIAAEPPKPVEIVEIPKPLPLPGQLLPPPSVRPETGPPRAR